MALLENVKNLLSHNKGQTFRSMLESLADIGYHVKYQVLNTCEYTDIPQNRERVYIACFRDENDCERFEFPHKSQSTVEISDLI